VYTCFDVEDSIPLKCSKRSALRASVAMWPWYIYQGHMEVGLLFLTTLSPAMFGKERLAKLRVGDYNSCVVTLVNIIHKW
jgi:hypothetical protein